MTERSSFARFVRDNAIGSVCDDYTPASMVAAIRTEFTNWKHAEIDRQAIQKTGEDNFSQGVTLALWSSLLEETRLL